MQPAERHTASVLTLGGGAEGDDGEHTKKKGRCIEHRPLIDLLESCVLALGELEAFTSALASVFLTLFSTCIASQQTVGAEQWTVLW